MNKAKKAAAIEQEKKFIKMNEQVIKTYWPIRNAMDKEERDTARRCILRAVAGIKECLMSLNRLNPPK